MDQSLKVPDIKTEPTDSTSSDRMEIPNEIQVENVKQESSDCLVQSEIDIKTEAQEDKSDFIVIAGTSHDMFHNVEIKLETIGEIFDNTCENLFNEVLQDPLEDSNEMKDKTTLNKKQKIDERKSSEMKNIKNESANTTSTGEMQMNCIEVENYSLHTELDIKMERQEDEISTFDSNFVEPRSNEPEQEVLLTSTNEKQHRLNSADQFLVREKHIPKGEKHICNVCDKTFTLKRSFIRHLRIHTGEKPFRCDICKISFSRKSSLDTHMLIHSGEKPYVCDVCKISFSQKGNLNTHMRIHSGEKPHSCDICTKVFNRKSTLNTHKLIHSGVKLFSCQECNKSFAQKTYLVTHRRIHSGEKPFSCDSCEKTFADKSTLTRHKRIHTGEKPYTCDICRRLFTLKSHLTQHKKNHYN